MSEQWTTPPPAKKHKKWPWVVGGITLAFFLLVGGCITLLAVSVNEVSNEFSAELESHAITKAQFDSVAIGTTKADVILNLGKQPESAQEFVNEGFLDETQVNKTSCIYYGEKNPVEKHGLAIVIGNVFQFCFDGADKLDSKNAY